MMRFIKNLNFPGQVKAINNKMKLLAQSTMFKIYMYIYIYKERERERERERENGYIINKISSIYYEILNLEFN